MRDLLSKLDAIVSETELKNPEDLQAKRNALADLEKDPVASDDPEISSAITQRKSDLEKEAKAKGFAESFEVGDEFGISFSEDHEIATTIVDILEDGIVIELDDIALEMLTNEGLNFLDGELSEGVAGAQKCWKGFRKVGTKAGTGANAGKRVNACKKIGEDEEVEESGLQYYTGVKKHGKEYMKKAAAAGREGASQKELGALKDKYSKAHKNEDHGPENPDAAVNYGEYDREGDMAKDDLRTIDDAAEELYSILRADDNLPEWVQSKITKAVDYIDTARDYMKAQKYEEGVAEGDVDEAKYQGREVPLGKKMAGDVKKSKVYVRKPNGNIVKVNFGDNKMRIKKSNPARRKSFRARHNCANPGPRHKARYWSCRSW
jgi:cell pole-organizing protein PopZ